VPLVWLRPPRHPRSLPRMRDDPGEKRSNFKLTSRRARITDHVWEIEELLTPLNWNAIQSRRMNYARSWTAIKLIATIVGLALLTIVLAFSSLNCLFASGTFPNDPKEQRVGLIWAGSLFLAAAASMVGVGVSIRRFRHKLKIERSSQGFSVNIKEPNVSSSPDRCKTDEISN